MELNDSEVVNRAINILSDKLKLGTTKFKRETECVDYLRLLIGARKVETFVVMYMDSRHRLIECQELATGSVDQTFVSPRAIVMKAIENCAKYIMVAHNHPSGDPHPSDADINSTQRLGEALDLFDIELHDHIIVGRAPGFPVWSIANQCELRV